MVMVSPTWATLLAGEGMGLETTGLAGAGCTEGAAGLLACLVPMLILASTPAATTSTTTPARIPPAIQGHLRRLRGGGWPGPPGSGCVNGGPLGAGGCQGGLPGPGGSCPAGRSHIGRFSDTAIPPLGYQAVSQERGHGHGLVNTT